MPSAPHADTSLRVLTSLPPLSARRRVHPRSLPTLMAINVLDLDATKACNLRCTYCFKSDNVRPRAAHMPLEVAMGAVDWLIEASLGAPQLWVNLLGGEPLIAWSMVKCLVPYAKRRAAQFGKGVQFGTTTNMTLLSPQVIEFARRWGMGWHCSVDGIPEVQNAQRPGLHGLPSAERAERGIPLALGHRALAMARATITPRLAHTMLDNVKYFYNKGFRSVGIAAADEPDWSGPELDEWDYQLGLIADYAIETYRAGEPLDFAGFTFITQMLISGEERQFGCGAGRGTVGINERGDIWPCHRFDGADLDSGSAGQWRMGNIFEAGFHHELHRALLDRDARSCKTAECASCSAARICAGGCPAANLQTTGDIYRQHPNTCVLVRSLHGHAVRFYETLRAEANPHFVKQFLTQDKPGA